MTNRQALLTDLRKKETRQSLRRVQPPVLKLPNRPISTAADNNHTYSNGFNCSPTKERPKTVDLGGLGKTSPKPPTKNLVHTGPPKFRRKNSIENLLSKGSPNTSPTFRKKSLDLHSTKSSSVNDDDYEEIPEVSEVKPYAVHDVIPPAERMAMNGRKGPERPAPPPKVVMTMKPAPPVVAPRVPRANTVSAIGSAMEQRLGLGSPTNIQKPSRTPPKLPQSPRRPRKDFETGKEVSEFIGRTV